MVTGLGAAIVGLGVGVAVAIVVVVEVVVVIGVVNTVEEVVVLDVQGPF